MSKQGGRMNVSGKRARCPPPCSGMSSERSSEGVRTANRPKATCEAMRITRPANRKRRHRKDTTERLLRHRCPCSATNLALRLALDLHGALALQLLLLLEVARQRLLPLVARDLRVEPVGDARLPLRRQQQHRADHAVRTRGVAVGRRRLLGGFEGATQGRHHLHAAAVVVELLAHRRQRLVEPAAGRREADPELASALDECGLLALGIRALLLQGRLGALELALARRQRLGRARRAGQESGGGAGGGERRREESGGRDRRAAWQESGNESKESKGVAGSPHGAAGCTARRAGRDRPGAARPALPSAPPASASSDRTAPSARRPPARSRTARPRRRPRRSRSRAARSGRARRWLWPPRRWRTRGRQ